MAGGIDWFRWHHGSVTDPKFQLVARKSKQALASVVAVWAFVLEQASASEERGTFGSIDCEAIDCLLGLGDGATEAILIAMGERGLVAGGRVGSWEKRQPKREDETSAERKRRQREREHELKIAAVVTCEQSRNVTQGHAQVTQGHDRGEESREEKKKKEGQAQAPLPDWLPVEAWSGYAEMRNRIRKHMTPRAQKLVLSALDKMRAKGLDIEQALDNSTRNSWVDVYEPKNSPASASSFAGVI